MNYGLEYCEFSTRASRSNTGTVRRANEVASEIRRRVEKDEEKKVAVTAIHKGVDESERVSYLEWLSDSETASSRASKELDPEGTFRVRSCYLTLNHKHAQTQAQYKELFSFVQTQLHEDWT